MKTQEKPEGYILINAKIVEGLMRFESILMPVNLVLYSSNSAYVGNLNIACFLSIVATWQVLNWEQIKLENRTMIYCNNIIAISWVKNAQVNSKVLNSENCSQRLIHRINSAERFLTDHPLTDKIQLWYKKWDK